VAVMEALTVGRPVVGYDIAGIGELSAAGWVHGVPRGAPAAAVAQALVKTMSSPSLVDHAELQSQAGTPAPTNSRMSTGPHWASPQRDGPLAALLRAALRAARIH
jgi:glycosyltransferase involved in cell wall biosynthesis